MENLQNNIFMNAVPPTWTRLAYPSNLNLSGWFMDMLNRVGELASWTSDFNVNDFCYILFYYFCATMYINVKFFLIASFVGMARGIL